jgi:hypothetical protein
MIEKFAFYTLGFTTHNDRVNKKNYIFRPHGTFMAFKINKYYFPAQYFLTGFYDTDAVCLGRGRY